eukprot:scaffold53479_cov58-Phaeocystis_antarctica.AAC.1
MASQFLAHMRYALAHLGRSDCRVMPRQAVSASRPTAGRPSQQFRRPRRQGRTIPRRNMGGARRSCSATGARPFAVVLPHDWPAL